MKGGESGALGLPPVSVGWEGQYRFMIGRCSCPFSAGSSEVGEGKETRVVPVLSKTTQGRNSGRMQTGNRFPRIFAQRALE